MRIAELSRTTGVPTATIKYYLREGLLPTGTATAPNQAQYSQRHVERLGLIRALREGADLPIATLARVFAAMDDHRATERPEYLTLAVRALSEPSDGPADDPADDLADDADADARRHVEQLLDLLGWDTDADSPGYDELIRGVAAVHRFLPGLITSGSQLRTHATAMREVAEVEIPATFDADRDPDGALRLAVLGTVLFEPVLLALRKLAHVDRRRTVARSHAPQTNRASTRGAPRRPRVDATPPGDSRNRA